MSYQSAIFLGYQQITSLATSTALTLPVGAQMAQGTSCNLSGSLLTVGGTITGAFVVGQIVQGTGIPANTYITQPGTLATQWFLSNPCTTQTSITVTAYADPGANVALIAVETANVRFLPGGGVPTASVGMPIAAGSLMLYDQGNLAGLRFIQQTSGAVLDVAYYRAAGMA